MEQPRRRSPRLIVVLGSIVALCAGLLPAKPALAAFGEATVVAANYDPVLHHNIVDVQVSVGGQTLTAPFLTNYNTTGKQTRWGFPTSEVLEEQPGTLTQYYQRGIVDWHSSPTCNPPGSYCLERRLVWDYFGGDRAVPPGFDQGTESAVRNVNPGDQLGPWGHEVSDTAVDGTPTGFRQFFYAYGGVASFGYPKSDARVDTPVPPPGVLSLARTPTEFIVTPGIVRQYFQAAILEYQPSLSSPIVLRLLGDDLRDLIYPCQAFQAFSSFHQATPVTSGSPISIEAVTTGSPQFLGTITVANSATEVCSARQDGAPCDPVQHPERFQPASVGQTICSGDVILTKDPAGDPDNHAVLELIFNGLVGAVMDMATAAQVTLSRATNGSVAVQVAQGSVAVDDSTVLSSGDSYITPDGTIIPTGTLFLLTVSAPPASASTTVKMVQNSAKVVVQRTGQSLTLGQGNQVVLTKSDASFAQSTQLTSGEQARVIYLQRVAPSVLGKKGYVPLPGLHAQPEGLSFTAATTSQPLTVGDAGGAGLEWNAKASASWITISPSSGAIAAQGSQRVTVQVNPTQARAAVTTSGTATATVVIDAGPGGQQTIPVTFSAAGPIS